MRGGGGFSIVAVISGDAIGAAPEPGTALFDVAFGRRAIAGGSFTATAFATPFPNAAWEARRGGARGGPADAFSCVTIMPGRLTTPDDLFMAAAR